MRRQHGWRILAIICGLFSAAVQAADPVPFATRFTPGSPRAEEPQPGTLSDSKTVLPTGTGAPANRIGPPAAPSFAGRMQSAQRLQQQQQQADDNRIKPTNWQMQNPSNPQNNTPTSPDLPGTVAPNNYFGPQFRAWNNMTPPASMTQLPFNQTAVPAINQTNLYTAPNNYYGGQFSAWNQLQNAQPQPNAFGGWNFR